MAVPLEYIQTLITNIITLSKGLPQSIPVATKEDKIYTVMSSPEGEDEWQTFNRRFDAMFGEDCRDKEGRLHHIRRGLHGMAKVSAYLEKLDVVSMPLELMALKLVRLNKEIVHLVCVKVVLFSGL